MKTKLMTLLGASLLLVSCDGPNQEANRLSGARALNPGHEVSKIPSLGNGYVARSEDGRVVFLCIDWHYANQKWIVVSECEILPAQKPLPVEGH